jgi:triosephosphate isomerase (TIM)
MLKDAGATHVIVGHSERRTDHHETNDIVKAKTVAAHRSGLVAIVCVGELEAELSAGQGPPLPSSPNSLPVHCRMP